MDPVHQLASYSWLQYSINPRNQTDVCFHEKFHKSKIGWSYNGKMQKSVLFPNTFS